MANFVDIPGYEKFYQINTNGIILSKDRIVRCKQGFRKIPGKQLKHRKDSSGYHYVTLYNDQGSKLFRIHRLLMIVFNPIENYNNFVVNHLDGNKTNNSLSNLQWCTHSENVKHALVNGLLNRPFCEKTNDYWEALLELRKLGWSNAKIGRAFGKSPSSIAETLKVLGKDKNKKGRYGGEF